MESTINKLAAEGFNIAGDAYERGRPDYPKEAVDFLIRELKMREGATIADVGAGTGKFTRLIIPSHARITAVEPVEGMKKKFSSISPDIPIVTGTAESLPFADESLNAVTVAQAFHWFNGPKAITEIHRVLKPHGKLGLIWNVRDESVDWVKRLTDIMDPYEQGAPRYRTGEWRKAFVTTKLFSALRCSQFYYVQKGTIETVVDRVASTSFIAALPEARKNEVLEKVRALMKTHPQTKDAEEIPVPYRTDVFVCEKID